MLQTSLLLINKTKTAISICNVFLVSKGNLFDFYFIDILCALDGMKCQILFSLNNNNDKYSKNFEWSLLQFCLVHYELTINFQSSRLYKDDISKSSQPLESLNCFNNNLIWKLYYRLLKKLMFRILSPLNPQTWYNLSWESMPYLKYMVKDGTRVCAPVKPSWIAAACTQNVWTIQDVSVQWRRQTRLVWIFAVNRT